MSQQQKEAMLLQDTPDSGSSIAQSDILSQKDLERFLSLLQKKRKELVQKTKGRVQSGDIILDTSEMADEVDLASVNTEQHVVFQLLDRDRKLLAEIDRAIAKIATGDYGYCEGSGEEIPKKRLELSPWTRYSVRHQEQLEQRQRKDVSYG